VPVPTRLDLHRAVVHAQDSSQPNRIISTQNPETDAEPFFSFPLSVHDLLEISSPLTIQPPPESFSSGNYSSLPIGHMLKSLFFQPDQTQDVYRKYGPNLEHPYSF
jgi:hypothetical protein